MLLSSRYSYSSWTVSVSNARDIIAVPCLSFSSDDEIQQSTALQWLAEFLTFAQEVLVPFTPRLIPAILPNLAHHVPMIQSSANRTNKLLANVIQSLPPPSETPSRQNTSERPPPSAPARNVPPSPIPAPNSPAASRQSTLPGQSRELSSPESIAESTVQAPPASNIAIQKRASLSADNGASRGLAPVDANGISAPSHGTRSHSPVSMRSTHQAAQVDRDAQNPEAFDYQATVNALTIQFLSEHEETRVAALKWLIMLHQKAPKKVRCLTIY